MMLHAIHCGDDQTVLQSFMNHSAAFPMELPSWFLRLFTKRGDAVLDPCMGSGTTAVAAKKLRRKYVSIELLKDRFSREFSGSFCADDGTIDWKSFVEFNSGNTKNHAWE